MKLPYVRPYKTTDCAQLASLYRQSTLYGGHHNQVLVYTPADDQRLHDRYNNLGFNRGGDYTCYRKDI